MGIIKPEAQRNFFDVHKGNADLIKLFLNGFDISAAYEKHISNTVVYAYILKPETFMQESFGFDKELLLVYSPFEHMEPRSIQAIDEIYRIYPFSGRVDALNCFFLSDDENVEEWIKSSASSESVRIIIPFSSKEITANKNDTWYLRNKLRRYFFGLDLFGYTLPLSDDTYFFGRQQIIARYIDSVKRGENRGVFGLRKTGKTSLLFKIMRVISEQQLGEVFIYDCKSPEVRKLRANELLYTIYSDICEKIGIPAASETNEVSVIRNLNALIKSIQDKKIVLIFDEIEYISFIAPLDEHWKSDFVDFWQTIWSIQSKFRNVSFIIAGVNASVSEMDSVEINERKIQNPLFGIVQSEYLTGLSKEECTTMVKTLGKRTGLKFDHTAIEYIYQQYGGHPLLTRLSCSKLNLFFGDIDRPIAIDSEKIKQHIDEINSELVYYFRHVVSELQEFYPDEYDMFEMLASGQTVDFLELSTAVELTRHLYDYGLIQNKPDGLPVVSLPVAAEFVAMELAKKEKRTTTYRLINCNERAKWISMRIKSIIQDMRQLEAAIVQKSQPMLFGPHSFPEADKLITIPEVVSEASFIAFINTINRCFIESIENYGKEIGKNQYFWQDICTCYSSLYPVLYRAKVYRHAQDHLKLTHQFQRDYHEFLQKDTEGMTGNSRDKWYVIQQKLLDALLTGIQLELNKLV